MLDTTLYFGYTNHWPTGYSYEENDSVAKCGKIRTITCWIVWKD